MIQYRIIDLRNLLLAYEKNPHLETRLDEMLRLYKELYGEEFPCPTTKTSL